MIFQGENLEQWETEKLAVSEVRKVGARQMLVAIVSELQRHLWSPGIRKVAAQAFSPCHAQGACLPVSQRTQPFLA